jgi:hypothetical protein
MDEKTTICQQENAEPVTMDQLSDEELSEIAITCFSAESFQCAICKIRIAEGMDPSRKIDCVYGLGEEVAKRLKAACARGRPLC